MAYNVVITPNAQRRLDEYVAYTVNVLKNTEAAKAILQDAIQTKNELASIADSKQLCVDKILSKNGYRKIRFRKHKFLMIYRIDGNDVIVDGMYHELQDYESIFSNEMKLK